MENGRGVIENTTRVAVAHMQRHATLWTRFKLVRRPLPSAFKLINMQLAGMAGV